MSALSALRMRWRRARRVWRNIPLRMRIGVLIGLVAVAGLIWQHTTTVPASERTESTATATSEPSEQAPASAGADDSVPAGGQPQQDPAVALPLPDTSVDAARATVQRFATNFASPNGDFDDWFGRISQDVAAQLQEQYRLTDIRNVAQAAVTSVTGPVNQTPGAMAFRVTYSDGTQVEVRVEMGVQAEGWKVINVIPVPAEAAPAPSDQDGQQPPAAATSEGGGR
ncbi:hypothetical protein [Mycobacterium sp. DBP42]|uniref:hypothetical protein n=1 Tax=Mycobacteriaceae TaxID=1762 RepID=UPI00110CCAF9|nr:hypothetical protein [Mycobacterium sp. DBP42]TMS50696.1 hypothetical protein E0T84_22685 [Mycobacterium sp. DBP42]